MSLATVLHPRSIAVVGASRDQRNVGRRILDGLLAGPFDGPVYAVNPSTDHVGAVPSHPSLTAIDRPVELVVVAIPAEHVLDVVEEAAAIGAGAVVVVSAGFAESGDEGEKRQRALSDSASEHGLRVVGPNCLGVANAHPDVRMNASFAPTLPRSGPVGLCSQSGALGIAVLDLADRIGLGLSSFVSIGNQADVSFADVVEHWGGDDQTRVGLLYVESFGEIERFRRVAAEVGPTMPLIAVKAGATAAGSRAAGSHTAALAGSDDAVEALCRQSGIIRAASLDDMFGIARICASQPLPLGTNATVVTNSGGPGVLCVDALRGAGFEVPELEATAQRALTERLPAAASVANPIDMLAGADSTTYAKVVTAVLDDTSTDVLVVIYTPVGLASDTEVRDAIEGAVAEARTRGCETTVLMSIVGTATTDRPHPDGETIPDFEFPEQLARLLGPVREYVSWHHASPGITHDAEQLGIDVSAVRSVIEQALDDRGPGWLTVSEARQTLTAAGVNLSVGRVVGERDAARRAAEEIGLPVAMSIASTDVVHKSDADGVRLGVDDLADVTAMFDEIVAAAQQRGDHVDGVLIAAMEHGVELLIGVERDPLYGPMVAFGLGGTDVEVLDDVAVRLAPLTDRDVEDQLRSIRGWELLDGHRGREPVDQRALGDALARVAALADAIAEISEIDINPLFARPDGVAAADVRIAVTRPPTSHR